MAREGMDAGAVRQVAAQLEQDATAVDHVVAAVDGLFQSIERDWKGSDSTRLHEQWVGQRRGEFTALAAALRHMATVARSNATDQDTASGVSGASAGNGSGVPAAPVQVLSHMPGLLDILKKEGVLNSLALVPGIGSVIQLYEAGREVDGIQDKLNGFVPGLGDFALDAPGLIPGLGEASGVVGVVADGSRAIHDVIEGDPTWGDAWNLGSDAVGIAFPEVGLGIAAFKTGVDVGKMISSVPAVHRAMDSFDGGVVAYGAAHYPNIATRYNGIGGFVNMVHDSAASVL